MRHLTKVLLTAALAAAFVSITLAQGGGRGGPRAMTEGTLLMNKSVQEELKLTDKQKDKLKEINDKMRADLKQAFTDKDQAAIAKINETANASAGEIIKDLDAKQQKRLLQIFVQVGTNEKTGNVLTVLSSANVQKELKLDDKQKEMVTKLAKDTTADAAELLKDAGKDKDKRKEANEKIATMRAAAVKKVQDTFSDTQKTTWKDLPGEKFDIKFETPGGKDKKTDK